MVPCVGAPEARVLAVGFLTFCALGYLVQPMLVKWFPRLRPFMMPLSIVFATAAALVLNDTSLYAVASGDCQGIYQLCGGGCFCMIMLGCWCPSF